MATKKTPAKKTTTSKKPVRKTARKASENTNTSVEQPVIHHPSQTAQQTQKRKTVSKTAAVLIGIIILFALLYLFRSAFVVGFVNGQPITRAEFNHQMEQDAGKQAMNEILTKDLIFQEAKKRHITISDAEVNNQIKTIENTLKKQGQNLDQALAAKGLTRQDLTDQIRIKAIVDKILGPQVKITDAQVNDYLDKNKDSLPQGQSTDQLKASVRQQLQQDALSQKFQDWIAGLQQKAKIDYLIKI